ncbi:MAG: hypothetical protein A3A86_06235 [Elusimicrobia bacterium RIFCSPLOWO2_01_FULL_60_11]|nr:MAG: hypothetical protein A3A86_06235 [Elusimicrobia bacterium RIFCSPLOWO2_01_FULL_60_11]
MKLKQGITGALWLALAMAGFSVPQAKADDTSANISIAKFVSNAKWGGDIRIRQENFWKSTAGQVDRSRQRFRLRYGLESTIQDIKVVFKMASGTGEQVSTNQSFDNLSGQKALWIDQAYLEWKAFEWMKLSGGRMSNPLWRVYSSDLVWDGDFNPEGFAETFEYKVHENITPFANFMQMVLDEDSSDTRDQWFYAFQIGAKTKLMEQLGLDIAGAYYRPTYETKNDFGQNVNNEGNTRVGAAPLTVLTSTFSIVHLTSQINAKLMSWPLKLQADYVKNIADNGHLPGAIANDQAGYQVGAILGKAGAAKTWETGYFYKYLEVNATIADISDSDFGDGGTNRKGHIFWFSFAPRDYLTLTAKFFNVEVLHPAYQATATGGITAIPPGADSINRLQLDLVCKF